MKIMRKSVILVIFLVILSNVSFAKVINIPEVSEGTLSGEDSEELPAPLEEEIDYAKGITKYYYSGNSLVYSEYDDLEEYSYFDEKKFYFQDRLGSNRITIDEEGDVKSFKSLPYGQVIQDGVQYGFTGKEKDKGSELHYFGARYYDSDLGKFTSVDPVKENEPYSYVGNNPMMFVDLFGYDGYEPTVADKAFLVENFGKPTSPMGLMDEITYRITSRGTIDMSVDKDALNDYFGSSRNNDVLESASMLLQNFDSALIQTFEGGKVKIEASDDLKFPINGLEPLSVSVEISNDFEMTTITSSISEFDPSLLVFRVDRGQIKVKPGLITGVLAGVASFFGSDKADIPEFHNANYLVSIGGLYIALFDEEGNQIGDIRDQLLNKYSPEELDRLSQEQYNKAVYDIIQDIE